jgi:hypothetical protein
MPCPKMLRFFIQASLVDVLMRTKFQVKIRKYDFAEKSGSLREISVKLLYLTQITTWVYIQGSAWDNTFFKYPIPWENKFCENSRFIEERIILLM